MEIIFLIVSFSASVIGSICGIGGGIIIKPLLDSLQIMSVNTISFLSGSTVLSMSIISLLKSRRNKRRTNDDESNSENENNDETNINLYIVISLAIGAIFGGVFGKKLFMILKTFLENENLLGFIQSFSMSIITLVTIIIIIFLRKGHKFKIVYNQNFLLTLFIGLVLGIVSSFLGIGGGPINILVLTIIFLMPTRVAALSNLFVIMFSQLSNLIFSIISNSVPEFNIVILLLMVIGGIAGGIIGSRLRDSLSSPAIEKLFSILMVIVLMINIANSFKFYFA